MRVCAVVGDVEKGPVSRTARVRVSQWLRPSDSERPIGAGRAVFESGQREDKPKPHGRPLRGRHPEARGQPRGRGPVYLDVYFSRPSRGLLTKKRKLCEKKNTSDKKFLARTCTFVTPSGP